MMSRHNSGSMLSGVLTVSAFVAGLAGIVLTSGSLSAAEPEWPPRLPGGVDYVSTSSPKMLISGDTLLPGVAIAKTPPTVDLLYYPEQNYAGSPWSVWGDGLAVEGRYYSAIGDHGSPAGNAFVFEYDPRTHSLKTLASTSNTIALPEGHYMPGKIHSRIDQGSDGWLYYSTHRGSTRVTIDKYHYRGDWILRTHPQTRVTEIVAHGPVPRNCIPTSVLDPDRLIFYGGTASGDVQNKTVTFFAYDIRERKVLHTAVNGPARCMIFAKSTGCVYYMNDVDDCLMKYDPSTGQPPQKMDARIGLRAATEELPDGWVYTTGNSDGRMWRFNTRTEQIEELGDLAAGTQLYVASIDADSTGRFIYYIPGAHGGSQKDGSPVIQYDTQHHSRKVIAFLQPVLHEEYGYITMGTYGTALSPDGSLLYVTWNGNCGGEDKRGRISFNTCALTVLHIPASER